ncbi:MAG: hypothetical protein H8E66_19855 [Planctomycetes bacterium]|nr:hypothetical protein [Planctomycetota bacterium]
MPSRRRRFPSVAPWPILLVLVLVGCDSPPPPADADAREPTFRDLVQQVRIGEATEIVVAQEVIGDEELALLTELPNLNHLAIERFSGTAVGLDYVARLKFLERLQLRGGEIGDDALAAIANCESLKNLNLPDANFSDAGLTALAPLSRLELLRFHTPNVTDEGMTQLAELRSLRFLHLIGVPITDDGLEHIESMKQLESFYVDDANVTDDGIERLLIALPELHLHINQHHSDRDPSKGTHPH